MGNTYDDYNYEVNMDFDEAMMGPGYEEEAQREYEEELVNDALGDISE